MLTLSTALNSIHRFTMSPNCFKHIYSPVANLKLNFSSELPKNVLEDLQSASQQAENGLIYDKKPFKMTLDSKKTYMWCLCGQSKNQPLCDGTHKSPYLKIKFKPIKFKVEKDGDYWLCQCKQTSHRPFCDGTHKREDIQAIKK